MPLGIWVVQVFSASGVLLEAASAAAVLEVVGSGEDLPWAVSLHCHFGLVGIHFGKVALQASVFQSLPVNY